jgi:Ras-related C3 botulinum toxin substrate 1
MAASSSDGGQQRTKQRLDAAGKIHKVVKCGIVGDGTVGKSCLLMTYTMAGFVEHYVPTIFDNFSVLEDFDGKLVNITLCMFSKKKKLEKKSRKKKKNPRNTN